MKTKITVLLTSLAFATSVFVISCTKKEAQVNNQTSNISQTSNNGSTIEPLIVVKPPVNSTADCLVYTNTCPSCPNGGTWQATINLFVLPNPISGKQLYYKYNSTSFKLYTGPFVVSSSYSNRPNCINCVLATSLTDANSSILSRRYNICQCLP